MTTTAQELLASNSDSGVTAHARRPWRTPVVIVGEMADAEHLNVAVADGGGGAGTSLS